MNVAAASAVVVIAIAVSAWIFRSRHDEVRPSSAADVLAISFLKRLRPRRCAARSEWRPPHTAETTATAGAYSRMNSRSASEKPPP